MIGSGRPGQGKFNTLVLNKIENDMIFSKECLFSVSKRFSIPASGTYHIVFDPRAVTSDLIVFQPIFFQGFGAGPIEIDFYGGTEFSAGTVSECFNRNEMSSITCEMIVNMNPTINNIGTKLPPEWEIPSDGVSATAVLGGSAGDNFVTNINKELVHCFKLTNKEADVATCVMSSSWLEYNYG